VGGGQITFIQVFFDTRLRWLGCERVPLTPHSPRGPAFGIRLHAVQLLPNAVERVDQSREGQAPPRLALALPFPWTIM